MAWGQQASSESEIPQSKYNSALSQLYRLDELWKDSSRHARKHDYLKWNMDLDAVYRELSEDVPAKGDDEQTFDNFNKALIELGIYSLGASNGFEAPSPEYKQRIAKIYYTLMRKEIFLRKLQNKHGKGAAYEDPMEDYMD